MTGKREPSTAPSKEGAHEQPKADKEKKSPDGKLRGRRIPHDYRRSPLPYEGSRVRVVCSVTLDTGSRGS